MADAQRSCWIDEHDGQVVLHLGGAWRLGALRELSRQLGGLNGPLHQAAAQVAPRMIDGAALQDIDTAAALLLLDSWSTAGADPATLELRDFDPRLGRIFEVVRSRFAETTVAAPRHKLAPIARVGQISAGVGSLLLGHVEFFGRTLVELSRVLLRPHTLRVHELFAQLGQVGVNAVPVVALVTFLIGVVMAYMLGLQAEKYGANIFVVDGVALGITREFSPLIVATIMAGRSGAAFTAQLGTMKLTEEIDAIRTLGLSAAAGAGGAARAGAGDDAAAAGVRRQRRRAGRRDGDVEPDAGHHAADLHRAAARGAGAAPLRHRAGQGAGVRAVHRRHRLPHGLLGQPRHALHRHQHHLHRGAEHRRGDPAGRDLRRHLPGARSCERSAAATR